VFASGEGQEELRTEPIAADARELGTPRGAGDPADVLHEAPGLPPEPNRHGRARAKGVFSPVRPRYRPPGSLRWLDLVSRAGASTSSCRGSVLSAIWQGDDHGA
jgi:hypothetical protein